MRVASARFATNKKADGSYFFYFSAFANALYWAESVGAKVSNNSNSFSVVSSTIDSAYTSTYANGMIHFASAGNNAKAWVDYPARLAVVNAVGGTNRFGARFSGSQYGPGLDFMAPGEDVLTTDRTGIAGFVTGDYVWVTGTSFASAYAAGVAALVISSHPGITGTQVETILQHSCTDMGPAGYDTGYGYAMLDASRAVNSPVPTPTPTPTPTPVATGHLTNLSTRLSVQTGPKVAIAGFIVNGTESKKVLIRAIGPSLSTFGIANLLQDPVLELRNTSSTIVSNDDWQTAANSAQIPQDFRPSDSRESAILATLQPGSYTVIASGSNNTSGTALIELYDLAPSADAHLTNVSTRGLVQNGGEVMIGGFVASGGNGYTQVLIRVLGPSLSSFGVADVLLDPTITVYDANGMRLAVNDNWKDTQQGLIEASGFAPRDDRESAIMITVPAGNYTAVVAGKNGLTGVALTEVYQR